MSTIDTSTWSSDTDLNVSIEGIPLNADSPITQTWLSIRALMAALKGDGDAIRAFLVPFSGATASADGTSGLVPAPEAGDQDKVLKGDGTWGTLSASDIPNIDASKIASGTIDLARLPAGALERLVTVADQTARYALTTTDVQLGDTVKQLDTGVMYIVVDASKLGQAAGYVEYTAGSAASVPWSGVTDKPSTFTPSSHTHASSDVSLMTGYVKAQSAAAILTTDTLNEAVGKLEKSIESMLQDKIFPVGSTYFSLTDSRNPNVILGFGTWVQIEGKFLLGASSSYAADSTGGEASHTLTASELPDPTTYLSVQYVFDGQTDSSSVWRFVVGNKQSTAWSGVGKIKSTSATIGQPHNNMPPYLAGYLWRRTA